MRPQSFEATKGEGGGGVGQRQGEVVARLTTASAIQLPLLRPHLSQQAEASRYSLTSLSLLRNQVYFEAIAAHN